MPLNANADRRHALGWYEASVVLPVIAGIVSGLRHDRPSVSVPEVLLWTALVAVVGLLPDRSWGRALPPSAFPVLVAVALVFPAAVAGGVALLGSFDRRELGREVRPVAAVFARARTALAVVFASGVFHRISAIDGRLLHVAAGGLAAAAICCLVAAALTSAHAALDGKTSVRGALEQTYDGGPLELAVTTLAIGAFGTLIARFYALDGAWTVVLFAPPLLVHHLFSARRADGASAEVGERDRSWKHLLNEMREQNKELERQTKILEWHLEREREAASELRELNRLKSDFVAVASHEIRTPLTSIIGYAHALLAPDAKSDPNLRDEFARGIARQGERLLALVQDVLTASSLEKGSVQLETEPVIVDDLCREVLEGFGDRGERVELELDPELPIIHTDRSLLGRVLMNLIDNALKYSPEGRPCSVSATGELEGVKITVADQGIGITEEEQAHIFERFYQAESASTEHVGGVGLGLAIVKDILDHLGGSIDVESAPGVGTTFTVRMPLRPTAVEGPPESAPAAGDAEALAGARLNA